MRRSPRIRTAALLALAGVLTAGLHLLAQQAGPQTGPLQQNFQLPRVDQPADKVIPDAKPAKLDVTITGPFKHDNLTIFLIHGEDRLKNKNFLLLSEALEQKKVIIHETKQVNDLQVENVSGEEVLLLSGDIISGGQQDRVITMDQVLPPKSGKLPLGVHCVEKTAPRWMSAYTDENRLFKASYDVLNSKGLRLANAVAMSQGEVWEKAEMAQHQLATKLKVDVKAAASTSSLQLTLKNEEVKKAADKYTAKLEGAIKDKKDVIGYAFAINNQVYGVDVYGSSAIFQKVWPRLVRANAIEAVMENEPTKSFKPPTADSVKKFMAEADAGKASGKEIGAGLHRIQADAKSNVQIQTFCPKAGGLIRGTYLAK